MKPCKNRQHDYDNPIRKGRAHYLCPDCGENITLDLIFIYEAIEDVKKIREEKKSKRKSK